MNFWECYACATDSFANTKVVAAKLGAVFSLRQGCVKGSHGLVLIGRVKLGPWLLSFHVIFEEFWNFPFYSSFKWYKTKYIVHTYLPKKEITNHSYNCLSHDWRDPSFLTCIRIDYILVVLLYILSRLPLKLGGLCYT